MNELILYGLVFILSIHIGSFLNVVGIRGLKGQDFVKGRSACPNCNHQLSFIDMIPILSWLVYRGQCRYCKDKISWIYPFGELLAGLIYTTIYYKLGFSLEVTPHYILATALLIATVMDLVDMTILDSVHVIGLIGIIGISLITGNLTNSVIGGASSFLLLYLIFILSKGKLGGADIKVYALIGAALGFFKALDTLFLASIISLLFGGVLLIQGKKIREVPVPFFPFITLGVIVSYYFSIY